MNEPRCRLEETLPERRRRRSITFVLPLVLAAALGCPSESAMPLDAAPPDARVIPDAGDGGVGDAAPDAAAPECLAATDCSDEDGCTVDDCVSGMCVHAADEGDCPVSGTIRTSEGVVLLPVRVTLEHSTERTYVSETEGTYVRTDLSDCARESVPVECGRQTIRLSNTEGEPASCLDPSATDVPCIENLPIVEDSSVDAPTTDGWEVPVVRVSGLVADEFGLPQVAVTVRFTASIPWSTDGAETIEVSNAAVTDDAGQYSLVLLASPSVAYQVTAGIPITDRRPLGDYAGSAMVTDATSVDLALPAAPPRCVMSGSIRSSDGVDFGEVELRVLGFSFGTRDPLYADQPIDYFAPRPDVWHPVDAPADESPYIPLLCGEHNFRLHSIDWPTCMGASDQPCFQRWGVANGQLVTDPFEDLLVSVVHVTGQVTDSVGAPVADADVSAVTGFVPYESVQNFTTTDADGRYDLVVLPTETWTLEVSLPEGDPRSLAPASADVMVDSADVVQDFTMDPPSGA